jgi:hypothetical protein
MNQQPLKVFEVEIEETVRYTYSIRAKDKTQAKRLASLAHRDDGADRAAANTEVTEQDVTYINEVA